MNTDFRLQLPLAYSDTEEDVIPYRLYVGHSGQFGGNIEEYEKSIQEKTDAVEALFGSYLPKGVFDTSRRFDSSSGYWYYEIPLDK